MIWNKTVYNKVNYYKNFEYELFTHKCFVDQSQNYFICNFHSSMINWYCRGFLHRIEGPAVTKADGEKIYFTWGDYVRQGD